jgi:uncharacterized membrane-anchored protein
MQEIGRIVEYVEFLKRELNVAVSHREFLEKERSKMRKEIVKLKSLLKANLLQKVERDNEKLRKRLLKTQWRLQDAKEENVMLETGNRLMTYYIDRLNK